MRANPVAEADGSALPIEITIDPEAAVRYKLYKYAYQRYSESQLEEAVGTYVEKSNGQPKESGMFERYWELMPSSDESAMDRQLSKFAAVKRSKNPNLSKLVSSPESQHFQIRLADFSQTPADRFETDKAIVALEHDLDPKNTTITAAQRTASKASLEQILTRRLKNGTLALFDKDGTIMAAANPNLDPKPQHPHEVPEWYFVSPDDGKVSDESFPQLSVHRDLTATGRDIITSKNASLPLVGDERDVALRHTVISKMINFDVYFEDK